MWLEYMIMYPPDNFATHIVTIYPLQTVSVGNSSNSDTPCSVNHKNSPMFYNIDYVYLFLPEIVVASRLLSFRVTSSHFQQRSARCYPKPSLPNLTFLVGAGIPPATIAATLLLPTLLTFGYVSQRFLADDSEPLPTVSVHVLTSAVRRSPSSAVNSVSTILPMCSDSLTASHCRTIQCQRLPTSFVVSSRVGNPQPKANQRVTLRQCR